MGITFVLISALISNQVSKCYCCALEKGGKTQNKMLKKESKCHAFISAL